MRGTSKSTLIGLVGGATLIASLSAPALAQSAMTTTATSTQREPGAPRSVARPADPRAQTLRDMQKRISVEFADTRLEDAIMFLEQAGNLPMDVAWLDTNTPIGLDKDRRITLSAKNATLQSILENALDRASDDFSQATWQFSRDGIIEVGPKEWLNSKKTLRLYDINDLLFVFPNFTDVPELDLDAVLQQGQGGGGGGGRGVFRAEESDEIEPDEEERAQEIIDIMTSTVEPDQWQVNGGSGATVRFFRGSLLISAPEYIHRQIGGHDFRK
jgi:hypothetical protein